jgi:hypothetical protein
MVGWGRNTDGQLSFPEGLLITPPKVIRPDTLRIKVQANDGVNHVDAIISVVLVSDPHEDVDGDGLSYEEEVLAGTDPLFPDSDQDGMHDGWEVGNRLDPLFDDSSRDDDFDGVANIDELAGGSNPAEWLDLDNDGMHDRWELQSGLAVGRDDGAEDHDGDLQSNFMEFILGGNPSDAGSVPGLHAWLEDMKFPIIEFKRSLIVSRYYYDTYLEVLTDEDKWQPLSAADLKLTHDSDGIERVVFHPPLGGKGFYRIKVTPKF